MATNKLMRRVETMLCLFGLTCLAAYGVSRAHSAHAQSAAISELETQWVLPSAGEPDRSLWSPRRIERHEQSLARHGELLPLALVEVPAVGIRVAAFEGTSARVLNLGVGRVPGPGMVGGQGNLALAGHRDGFFRGLKDVAIGDDVFVRHADGTDRYRVTELSVVEPEDVSVLAPTERPALTLITCYPFYFVGSAPQRFIVRAERNADESILETAY